MVNNVQFPYEFKELDPDETALIKSMHDANPTQFIKVGPESYILYKPYQKDAVNIYNMPLRPSDVFVGSYHRSGTTWTQELVWLLTNNLDYDKAKSIPLTQRYPFLESFMFFDEVTLEAFIENIMKTEPNVSKEKLLQMYPLTPASEIMAAAPSPRFIKTHLPMSLLPPSLLDTAKLVYVARDPRDVAVSCYHHAILFKMLKFPRGFKDFWDIFHKNMFLLTPYFEHVKEAWEKRNHPNMLFLFYEELAKDLPASIRRVAQFFNKKLDDKQIDQLCDHLSIKNFKKNTSINFEDVRILGILSPGETFIRKGKTGGWRDYFDEEMTQQAGRWIADNLQDTDLRFPSMSDIVL